jgi:CBS domain-containing protein
VTAKTSKLRASDVMTADPLCVAPSTTLRELTRMLDDNEISGAPVLDSQGAVIGIVSKTGLIRRCAEGIDDIPPAYLFETLSEQGSDGERELVPEPQVSVEDLMTEDPLTVAPDEPASKVARLMSEHRIHRVIVVDEERYPLGIITSLDLLRHWRQAP